MPIIRRVIAGAGVPVLVAGLVVAGTSASAVRPAPRVTFKGSAPAFVSHAGVFRQVRSEARISFFVAMPWRNQRGLVRFDRAVSTPGTASYGHYLSPQRFRARYSAPRADVRRVRAWLSSQGLRPGRLSANHLLLAASGTAASVEKAFGTSLARYRYRGHTVRAPSRPISLPRDISHLVSGIVGLDTVPATHFGRPDAPPPPAFRNARPCSHYYGEKVAPPGPFPGGQATGLQIPAAYGQAQPLVPCGYTPHQLAGAYGVNKAIRRGIDGRGQTVVITDAFASPTMRRDVEIYSRRHKLPKPDYKQKRFLPVKKGSIALKQGWHGEETLDVEAVHSMAPRARIYYLGAANPGKGLIKTLNWGVDHRVGRIITNSWGYLGENASQGAINTFHQIFQQAAATGIGLYFSSGDGGDERTTIGYASTDFPPSSPWVTAVGGTSLAVGPLRNYRFETGWGTFITNLSVDGTGWDPRPPGTFLYGSGGGTSKLFVQPRYQRGVVPAAKAGKYGGRGRAVPDVAAVGDPNTGMLIGETQTNPGGKIAYGEFRIGGTSLSSPLFAGIMALADQAAGFHHGFANPALYRLHGTRAFHDVRPARIREALVRIDFTNEFDATQGYTVTLRTLGMDGSLATAGGWDNVTGLGSPRGLRFLRALPHG